VDRQLTLILSSCCYFGTYLAVDKSVSLQTGLAYEPTANKAILAVFDDGIIGLAYTGLAYIGRQTTDEWLALRIANLEHWEYRNGKPIWQAQFAGGHSIGRVSAALYRLEQQLATLSSNLTRIQAESWFKEFFEVLGTGFAWKGHAARALPFQFRITKQRQSSNIVLTWSGRHDCFVSGRAHSLMWSPHGWCTTGELNGLLEDLISVRHPSRRELLVSLIQKKAREHPNLIGDTVTSLSISRPQMSGGQPGHAIVACHFAGPPWGVVETEGGPLFTAVDYLPWLITSGVICAPAIRSRNWELHLETTTYRIRVDSHSQEGEEQSTSSSAVAGQRRKARP
jgi:hypothetical protein